MFPLPYFLLLTTLLTSVSSFYILEMHVENLPKDYNFRTCSDNMTHEIRINRESNCYDLFRELLPIEEVRLSHEFKNVIAWYRGNIINVRYRIYCGETYYGPTCSNQCIETTTPDISYLCSSEGKRVCLAGFSGPLCARTLPEDAISYAPKKPEIRQPMMKILPVSHGKYSYDDPEEEPETTMHVHEQNVKGEEAKQKEDVSTGYGVTEVLICIGVLVVAIGVVVMVVFIRRTNRKVTEEENIYSLVAPPSKKLPPSPAPYKKEQRSASYAFERYSEEPRRHSWQTQRPIVYMSQQQHV